MANNFLRYKYFLITRASSEEIYIGIKNIFAKNAYVAKAKTNNALKIAMETEAQLQAFALTTLVNSIVKCLLIEDKCKLNGGIKLNEAFETSIDIIEENELIGSITQYKAANTCVEPTLDFEMKLKPHVMRHIYYPVISESFILGFTPKAISDNAIKTALNRAAYSCARALIWLPGAIVTETQSKGELLSRIRTNIDTIKRMGCKGISLVSLAPQANITDIYRSLPIKGVIRSAYRSTPSLFRWTIIRDIKEKTLQELGKLTIAQIKLTEITNKENI